MDITKPLMVDFKRKDRHHIGKQDLEFLPSLLLHHCHSHFASLLILEHQVPFKFLLYNRWKVNEAYLANSWVLSMAFWQVTLELWLVNFDLKNQGLQELGHSALMGIAEWLLDSSLHSNLWDFDELASKELCSFQCFCSTSPSFHLISPLPSFGEE